MTFTIGIIGKPSSGKTTFLNATCLTNAKVSELPFTTIEPNKGVAYVKTNCICKELNVEDNPKNSICLEGFRFIPINMLDVAGLVPDAHKGKGLGNKFLTDLVKADVLLHIVDISGSLDKSGNIVSMGKNDPFEDIVFLENEINFWFKDIIEREDWSKFTKGISTEKRKVVGALHDRPEILRKISKPILIVANKIDKEISEKNFIELKNKYNGPILPCSALAEHLLRKYHENKIIAYIPGSSDFKIIQKQKLTSQELETLNKIKEKILIPNNGTGVQNILNYASNNIANQICVYPVSDVNTFSDNKGNVLPDAFLVKKGTRLRDFVRDKIHSEIAENFMFGIDARTKKRLGENYKLQDKNVIKIVTSSKK